MQFTQALNHLRGGEALRRSFWPEGYFVFAQVPATIGKDIVPKMQSLPDAVKSIFQARFDDSSLQIDSIYYCDQFASVDQSNVIRGYSPSVQDVMANDWEFLTVNVEL